ncbi:MAG: iron-sulfur cluster insertion protein ErpA [Pseudomonadota bacterium]
MPETAPTPSSAKVTVSDRAAKRIAAILEKEAMGAMLRVGVAGGGCSGFQYTFDIVKDRQGDDLAIEKNGITVLIDQMSLEFMDGAEVDFADEIIGAAFRINNPNATANCGCGTSFSV